METGSRHHHFDLIVYLQKPSDIASHLSPETAVFSTHLSTSKTSDDLGQPPLKLGLITLCREGQKMCLRFKPRLDKHPADVGFDRQHHPNHERRLSVGDELSQRVLSGSTLFSAFAVSKPIDRRRAKVEQVPTLGAETSEENPAVWGFL
jgi:hypothetical protein